MILQAGRNDGLHRQGVALIINKEFSKSMTSYQAISERLICATFNTVEGPTTVFQTYAPDSSYSNETSEEFYDLLQDKIKALPRNNKYILLGDFNAKVGTDQQENWPREVGKYGLGQANDRGYHLLQFCAINELVITNTLFKHKKARRVTWKSPDGGTANQIDYIIVQQKWKSRIKNCRSYQSADIGSDHSLVLVNVSLTPEKQRKQKTVANRFDVFKLTNDEQIAKTFSISIGGAFEPLLELEDYEIDEFYSKFKEATNKTTEKVVGFKRNNLVEKLPQSIEVLCEERRQARLQTLNKPKVAIYRKKYHTLNKKVKTAVRKHKRTMLEQKVEQLEDDFHHNRSHNLFKTVREMEGKPKKPLNIVKDKKGETHTNTAEVLNCWEDHFSQHLNTEFPHDPTAINEIPGVRPQDTEAHPLITREEIDKALKSMKYQ